MSDVMPEETSRAHAPSETTSLRLWPGVLVLAALGLTRIWSVVGEPFPTKFFLGLIVSPLIAILLLNLWWLLGSRIRWSDRWLVVGTFIVVAIATVFLAGKNFPPMALIMYAVPLVALLWVGWLLLSYYLPWSVRRAGLVLIFVVTGIWFSLLRVDGMDGNFASTINWRWTPTPEEKLLSELKSKATPPESGELTDVPDLTAGEGDWTGFRGPLRDSRLTGVRIRTDWDKTPPKEVWKHRIGPGWSSFSVIGDKIFTQEQRGSDELVVCYNANTGDVVWEHRDPTRFEEIVAGPGPRGTPTFHEGRLYTQGANGLLNCLNAATGKVYWSADIVKDSKAAIPQWGFSSSPCIFHGLVSVFAGGPDGKSVVAYKIDTGEFAWAAGEGLQSYCSTQPATIGGVEELLISTNEGLFAFEPETGKVIWEHRWPVEQARVVQPAVLSDTDLLLGTGMSGGTRRIRVMYEDDKLVAKEIWTAKVFKPYFNDFVFTEGNLYGFDGNIFMCVDLNDGKMKWRARGYGNGQVLLLAEDNILLILTEQGEVALVQADPDNHVEISRFKAIEGKTWNHPVIAHGKLFVRNAEEIACFELPIIEMESIDPVESASD